MAIGTVAPAPVSRTPSAPARPRATMSRSARLDLIAAAALGIAGVVATIVVVIAVSLP